MKAQVALIILSMITPFLSLKTMELLQDLMVIMEQSMELSIQKLSQMALKMLQLLCGIKKML